MNRLPVPLLVALLGACSQNGDAGRDTAPAASPTAAAAAPTERPFPAPTASKADSRSAGAVSSYSSLKDCTVIERRAEEDWSVSRCAGQGGYSLLLDYGDAREDLRLVDIAGKKTDLGLDRLGGSGFNSLGDTLEWRGAPGRSGFVPNALIVRNRVVTDPERPEAPTAFLMVIDLAKACITAQVPPGPDQNAAARAAADQADPSCRGN